MSFYLILLLVNVACFLPLYALHFRDAPNPFAFVLVADRLSKGWPVRWLFDKARSPDPFRINFDFTFVVLLAAAAGYRTGAGVWFATALLVLGFIEIGYTSLMHAVFKRPPALGSDLALLRSGVALAQRQRYWIALAAGLLLGVLVYVSYELTATLLRRTPAGGSWLPLAVALLLLPSAFYRWQSYSYAEFVWRTVYSPALHFYRNVRYGRRVKAVLAKDPEYFERHNLFKGIEFGRTPNVVIICIESYGSVVHRDPRYAAGVSDLFRDYERQLTNAGYGFASTHSEAPLFAGGSWLSYASFTYGVAVTDLQLFDALFTHPSNFARYESLFHVLNRNGYENVLLCPLGGVDLHTVDWASVDRCFQAQRKILYADLGYVGPRVNYFGLIRRHSPLDQYSLNFAYERAQRTSRGPFSLFFCTLNSHFPWHSAPKAVADWQTLNDPNASLATLNDVSMLDRYVAAIRYQLDYTLRFAVQRSGDAPLIILFGDHQPPVITPESMGKKTPVHVLSRNRALVDVFLEQGFAPRIDLAGIEPRAIRHEGFLSLFMKAMNAAYGTSRALDLPYRERGTTLLEDPDLAGAPAATP